MTILQRLKDFRVTENIGAQERKLRIWGGVALVALALYQAAPAFLGFVGFMLALTGALKFCPGYGFLGRDSCEAEKG
ncbi:YgaP family membrane protein [Rubrimonas sp.]|uniref:YgaP family membrane protein n=1 Tax=Rubrimonas sp. TaxID=2036015 RepID=UPI002FDD54BA